MAKSRANCIAFFGILKVLFITFDPEGCSTYSELLRTTGKIVPEVVRVLSCFHQKEFYFNKIMLILTLPIEPKKCLQNLMGSNSCLAHHIVQTYTCFDPWPIFFKGKNCIILQKLKVRPMSSLPAIPRNGISVGSNNWLADG